MLLHVIEPALPVYAACHPITWQRRCEEVSYSGPFVDDVQHRHAAQLAGIEGLAAGGGIKRSPIEVDTPPIVESLQDGRFEFSEVGVVIIEAVGQGPERLTSVE
jgi:hypothetical protein